MAKAWHLTTPSQMVVISSGRKLVMFRRVPFFIL
jgi:hypothetical protein